MKSGGEALPLFERTNFPLSSRWVARPAAKKRVVLLLHGLGSSGADWFPQWTVLEAKWPVLTVDLPGHGESPPLRNPTTMAGLAESLADLLADQGLHQVHLVGLSLGAVVGLQLAVDQPQLLRSMVLVNGFGRFRPGKGGVLSALGRFVLLLMGRMDWVGAWVARSVFPGADQVQFRQQAAARIAAVDRTTYWHYLRALASFDVLDQLGGVAIPALVVAGEDDGIVGLQAKKELAKRLPQADLHVIPNSGHATPIDAMERFNGMMMSWLDKVD